MALPARLLPDRRRRRRRHVGERHPLLRHFADALSHNDRYHKLQRLLANVDGGEPENILILGSDKRANGPATRAAPTRRCCCASTPTRNAIALMSIPRDLKVEIPGFGTEKFNAAYTYGGPKLTLRVVKELTGLPINHVVNVDFLGFVRAVYAIGCVYVDVDRRYYHSNAESSEEYAEINVQPGYQLLCGKKALQYVRYRHTDTDLVRAARQQDFLSAARQRVPVLDLFIDRDQLLDIFTEYTTSDISDGETVLEVLKLFIDSRNAEIHEVHFPAELGPSYVYASPEAIEGAVAKFLGIEASEGSRGTLEDEPENQQGNGRAKKKKQEEEEEGEAAGRGAEAAGQRRTRARPRSGRNRGEDRRPQGQRRLPGLLPDAAALGRRLRGNQPLSEGRRPARLPLQGHRRQPPCRLPDGAGRRTLRRHPLLRRPGDPRLVGPADPQRAERNARDPRPRIRDLHRRRPRRRWSPGIAATTATGSPTTCSTR